MIRIGIAGCGVVAGYGHGPVLRESQEFDLAAVFDPVPEAAEAFATRFGSTPFFDEDAFYDLDLDALVVASPLGTHRHHVERAAEAKWHVLCEKPIAPTEEDAVAMELAMTAIGRVFAVGFVYRHSPVTRVLLDWARDGSIGEVRIARLSYLWSLHGRYENGSESPRWRGRMEEGGPLIDCGVHFLDLARLFLGDAGSIQGVGGWLADYEAPDYMLATTAHQNGRLGVTEVGFSYGHTARDPANLFTYDLIGTGGTARYDRNGWLLERRNGADTIVVPGGSEKDFAEMYRAFARRIRGEVEPLLATAADARLVTQMATIATA